MTDDAVEPSDRVPDEWHPPILKYENSMEEGNTPPLSSCFRSFEGDPIPVLAEMLATHQSYCAANGLDWSQCYGDLYAANSRWQSRIDNASVFRAKQGNDHASQASKGSVSLPHLHGNYCLVASLAAGGCGEVFLAIDRRSGERVIAKLPRLDVLEDAVLALEQERNALITLPKHSGLSRLLCKELDDEEVPALILEFEKAAPLSKIKDRTAERVVSWMIQICDALQAAHDAGVHHCDMKPDNVLIRQRDDRAVLIDFGLSQTLLRWSREHPTPVPLAGTPAFFAPELCDTNLEPAPGQVDVFGLGALFYDLLTGRPPFEAPTKELAISRAQRYDLDWNALEAAPYPNALKAICRRAIAREPEDRYPTPSAMRRALLRTGVGRRVTLLNRTKRIANWRNVAALLALFSLTALVFSVVRYTDSVAGPDERAVSLPALPAPEPPEWQQMAIEQGIDLEAITASDFTITIETAKRGYSAWSERKETDYDRAKIHVAIAPRLIDLAEVLQYRIGKRTWQSLSVNLSTRGYYGILSWRDVEVDGPVELRLGHPSPQNGDFMIGPFLYPVSLQDLVALDEATLLQDQIRAASMAECFDMTRAGWNLRMEFQASFGKIIKSLRFGRTRDTINYIAKEGGPSGNRRFYSDYPLPNTMSLSDAFAAAASDIQDANVLWLQIEFIDGSISEPVVYQQQNRFGHDGSVADAKKMLAEMVAAGHQAPPMGKMAGRLFIIDGLARIAEALTQIEYGDSPKRILHAYPVNAKARGQRRILSSLLSDNTLDPGGTAKSSFQLNDGVLHAPVVVPPCWNRIYFQGRFSDGSVTAIFSVENENRVPGFEVDLIRVNSGKIDLPLYVFAYDKYGENRKHRLLGGKQSSLFQGRILPIQTDFTTPMPPAIKEVKYYRDKRLRDELQKPTAGTLYASFIDENGHRVGSCEYYLDQKRLDKIIAMAGNIEKRDGVPR